MKNKFKINDTVYVIGVSAFTASDRNINKIGKITGCEYFVGICEMIYSVEFKNKTLNYYDSGKLIKIGEANGQ